MLSGAANQALWDIQRQTASIANPFPNRPALLEETDETFGFAGGVLSEWQKSLSGLAGEEFADMDTGWTYSRWEANAMGLTRQGQARANFMGLNMAYWLYVELGP